MVALSRIVAWQAVAQWNTWLHMSQLPAEVRRELLEGPIAPDGLFGLRLQNRLKPRPPLLRPALLLHSGSLRSHTSRGPKDHAGPTHPLSCLKNCGDSGNDGTRGTFVSSRLRV